MAFPSPARDAVGHRRRDGLASPSSPPATRRRPSAGSTPRPSPAPTRRRAADPGRRRRKTPKPKPQIKRGEVYVEVFNNSGIKGLAAGTAAKATQVGWAVVGEDNWYGVIPTTTVYFPPRLKAAGKQLALDLGIKRTAPAVGAMKLDRLTIILTTDAPR